MRNLKRALSLALASVMLLGMMVVGTGASYADVDSADNVEAIEVMQAVGVMSGDDKGNFNPDQKVTRGEIAVVMSNLLNLQVNDFLNAKLPFTDVPQWAVPYVAACYADGITAGISATEYGFNYEVTTAQAALMMMKALGYFQFAPDFGADWQLSTIKQGSQIDLFDGISAGASAALTRNEVAQMALNALESDMVYYEGSQGTNIKLPDGTEVLTGYSIVYKPITVNSEGSNNYAGSVLGSDGLGYRQLCEQLYKTDLKKQSTYDAMERPAYAWSYKTKNIGTYSDTPDYTFVVGKGQTAAKLIDDNMGKSIIDAGSIAYINGVSNATTAATSLNVGDIVEIYMNDAAVETVARVAVTRYTADRLDADVATKGEGSDMEVRLPGVAGLTSYTDADNVIGYEGLKKDDVVYYYPDNDGVYHVFKAESFDGKLTSINNKNPYTYVVDGTTYTANGSIPAATVGIDTVVFNTQYRFWVDNNGYVVYTDELEDALSDYVVIQAMKYVGTDDNSALGDEARVEARLVKMDGTTQVVTINSIVNYVSGKTCKWVGSTTSASDSAVNSAAASSGIQGRYLVVDTASTPSLNGTVAGFEDDVFFTYTINSDGEYDLTYVNGTDLSSTEITGSITLQAGKVFDGTNPLPVTDDTVFVVAKESNGTKFAAYTGKNNVPDLTTAKGAYVTKDGVITYMYIDAYTGSTFTGDTLFIVDASPIAYYEVKKDDGTKYGYNTYKAAVNGKYEEVKIAASSLGTVTATGASVAVAAFNPTYNDDGVITNLTAASNDPLAFGYKLTGTTLVTGKTYGSATYANAYVCENDAPVFYMDEDGDVTEMVASNLSADANDQIYVVTTNATDNKVKFLVVVEKDADETGIILTASDNSVTSAGTYQDPAIGNATVIKYTVKNGANVTIAPEAGCQITTDNTAPYWDSMSSTLSYASVTTGTWIAIKVVAEDTTVTYYAIEVIA